MTSKAIMLLHYSFLIFLGLIEKRVQRGQKRWGESEEWIVTFAHIKLSAFYSIAAFQSHGKENTKIVNVKEMW